MTTKKNYTTKELAEKLGMTRKQTRRYLRKMEKFNDNKYTNYQWQSKKEFEKDLIIIKQMIEGKDKEEAK